MCGKYYELCEITRDCLCGCECGLWDSSTKLNIITANRSLLVIHTLIDCCSSLLSNRIPSNKVVPLNLKNCGRIFKLKFTEAQQKGEAEQSEMNCFTRMNIELEPHCVPYFPQKEFSLHLNFISRNQTKSFLCKELQGISLCGKTGLSVLGQEMYSSEFRWRRG